jgi:hypothetical protein
MRRLAIQNSLKCMRTLQIFIDPHWYFILDTELILRSIKLFIYIQTNVCVNVNAYALKNKLWTTLYIIQHNLCSFTSINTCTKCITWKCLAIHLMTTLVCFYWTSRGHLSWEVTFDIPHEWLPKTGLTVYNFLLFYFVLAVYCFSLNV